MNSPPVPEVYGDLEDWTKDLEPFPEICSCRPLRNFPHVDNPPLLVPPLSLLVQLTALLLASLPVTSEPTPTTAVKRSGQQLNRVVFRAV